MPMIDRTVVDVLVFNQTTCVANGSTLPFYGTVEKADNYFSMMLEGQQWCCTDRTRKIQALVSSTKRIDRLNFVGVMHDPSQPLQFPRGTDTLVPVDVEEACYQLALALLSGVDPDTEADNINVTLQAYGLGLRSEYDRTTVPPHTVAGIPSPTAWNLLKPYLSARLEMLLRRVS